MNTRFFKENGSAIITSVIILLLVANYVFLIVPRNETAIDTYNKSRLGQFNTQLTNTLLDCANAIDTRELKEVILKKARLIYNTDSLRRDSLDKKLKANKGKAAARPKAKNALDAQFINPGSAFYNNINNNIILKQVKVLNVKSGIDKVVLSTNIRFSFDLKWLRYAVKDTTASFFRQLSNIYYEKPIDKKSLKDKLSGAVPFESWIVYDINENDKKIETLVNNGIDFSESDSLKKASSKRGVVTFSFSDKRFYKRSFNINGTNNYVMLVGAVSEAQFKDDALAPDVGATLLAIIFVILLFLCIPLIKPLISSAKESLSQTDLMQATACIGLFAVVVACFVFTSVLSYINKNKTHTQLAALHHGIASEFESEINRYKSYIKVIYLWRTENYVHREIPPSFTDSTITGVQNFFVMNRAGDMIKDVTDNDTLITRKNFSERDYHQLLINPGTPYSEAFSAVYSKNDNVYKLVYASNINDSVYGFAYKPRFIKNAFAQDLGYLICNKDGLVINHSDSSKSLNENLYLNYKTDYGILKLLHGFSDTCFNLRYDHDNYTFYGKPLRYAYDSTNSYPLYLLTFKKVNFEDKLKIYSVVNGFIISAAYALLLMLLAFLYSTVFYSGSIRVFSKFHFYWLFPDDSRKKEYKYLLWTNYFFAALTIAAFCCGFKHILFCSVITGVNLVFLNFTVFNQRELFFSSGLLAAGKKGKGRLALFIVFILASQLVTIYLYLAGFFGIGLCLLLSAQLLYLSQLKKEFSRVQVPAGISKVLSRWRFTSYIVSHIAYHYLMVPCIIIFCLFNLESGKYDAFMANPVSTAKAQSAGAELKDAAYPVSLEDFFYTLKGIEPPTLQPLSEAKFDRYSAAKSAWGPGAFLLHGPAETRLKVIVWGLVITGLMLYLLTILINFYSGRFFFFDLSEGTRLDYFKQEKNKFLNSEIILPPYTHGNLMQLAMHEKPGPESQHVLEPRIIDLIKDEHITSIEKIELLNIENIKTYGDMYLLVWNSLDEDERFTLSDFAEDFFVNYKNKKDLISLIKKGLIITDPLTGRLRLMNFGFRVYIRKELSAQPSLLPAIEPARGTFSKWRLPLLIIATSGLLFLLYVSRESYDKVALVVGSLVSALGAMFGLLKNYKKEGA